MNNNVKSVFLLSVILVMIIHGCHDGGHEREIEEVSLVLGAYTAPKAAYEKEIIPQFKKYWLEKRGQKVMFEESYLGSGVQTNAILVGFEVDIAALSLEKDIVRLEDAGLITHDWKNRKYNGFVTRSVVVIVFRGGNPRDIRGWHDLARDEIEVLHPNPKTSGGGMWTVNAVYGAGLRISTAEYGRPDPSYAKELFKSIQRNVKVMDDSGRASVATFVNGFGDALLTYENEAILLRNRGRPIEYIIPDATILIENPIAVVDANVEKHGTREVAEAFVDFVLTKECQRIFGRYGFRPVDNEVLKEFSGKYPLPRDLFDIRYLGGWDEVERIIYGPEGVWDTVMTELKRRIN